jgi:hypothetical protein
MTEGAAITAAWADYFTVADTMRPMSEMPEPRVVTYMVDETMSRHWVSWVSSSHEWLTDLDFDEFQAVGWLPD